LFYKFCKTKLCESRSKITELWQEGCIRSRKSKSMALPRNICAIGREKEKQRPLSRFEMENQKMHRRAGPSLLPTGLAFG
jgi:hypothetical protein